MRNALVRLRVVGLPERPAVAEAAARRGAAPAEAAAGRDAVADEKQRMMQGLLARFGAWSRANGAPLFVVGIGWPGEDMRWLSRVAAEEGIDYLDLREPVGGPVGADRTRYELPVDRHPNAAGHALIADAAWPWLEPRLGALRYRPRRGYEAPSEEAPQRR